MANDPSVQSVARVYATAYLDAAGPAKVSEAIEELSSFIDDVLTTQRKLDDILQSNVIGADDKVQLIDRAVKGKSSPLFLSLLRVLAKRGRLELLRAIRSVAVLESERRQGKRRALVSSSAELSQESLGAIKSTLAASLGCEPILETRIDPSLLGGVVIRVGDTVYDGSLKSQIKQLRGRLRERCLNEIQRGRDRFSHPEGN